MLSAIEILRIARSWFHDKATANVMTAIFLAESGGNPRAEGDHQSTLNSRYDRYACNGFLSFGLGQVFLGVHTPMIQTMSGLSAPCELAEWLKDPDNNMRACAAILANQGFSAWSVYNVDHHTRYMADVEAASAALDTETAPPPVIPPVESPRQLSLPLTVVIHDASGATFSAVVTE